MDDMNTMEYPEIIIGLVAPIGSNIELMEERLHHYLKEYGYEVMPIKITELLEQKLSIEASDKIRLKEIKSLFTFFKMESCTALRKKMGGDYFATLAIQEIIKNRKTGKKIVYLINQLKNLDEYKCLNEVYGENYIQISCFSNYKQRDAALKNNFKNDSLQKLGDVKKIANKYLNMIDKDTKLDCNSILTDTVHKLIEKDFVELEPLEGGSPLHYEKGQQVAKLFDKSHYFVNLDKVDPDVDFQIRKFVHLLFGIHNEYPTESEFGMAVAYTVSKRSNFPGERHVGACIVSQYGELISCGSIRAPVGHSNPNMSDQKLIEESYSVHKSNIKIYEDKINNSDIENVSKREIIKFIRNSLEFHPCTHAEMSAIADAVKLGVSIRGAVLYSTTFPCHMCAKDIISSGISKVVFLEAFPKSKNGELYTKLIAIDQESLLPKKLPFQTFFGVGPRRYNYIYSLENSQKPTENNNTQLIPPLLKNRRAECYSWLENNKIKENEKKENKKRKIKNIRSK